MEKFAAAYPYLAGRGRVIHSSEDTEGNTSYETYLRGEVSTYSDKMLLLYLLFVLDLYKKGKNLSELIMRFTTAMYGYASLEAAEKKLMYSQEAKRVADAYLQKVGMMKLE